MVGRWEAQTRPIEMQQLAPPKPSPVATKQEAGEDPPCPGRQHPRLQDNEGRRHFDKAPFSQAPTARPSCAKQHHCLRGDHLGGQESQCSLSSLCVLSSLGSASPPLAACTGAGAGGDCPTSSLKAFAPFQVGDGDRKQQEKEIGLHPT